MWHGQKGTHIWASWLTHTDLRYKSRSESESEFELSPNGSSGELRDRFYGFSGRVLILAFNYFVNLLLFYVMSYIYCLFLSLPLFFCFRCMCPTGYTGKDCDTKYKPCSPSPCQNGGTCRSNGLSYECKCPKGKKINFIL